MGCPRCATRVRNGLLTLDGVLVADVFLERIAFRLSSADTQRFVTYQRYTRMEPFVTYNVIIAGASFAGLAVAAQLRGKRVLLLDFRPGWGSGAKRSTAAISRTPCATQSSATCSSWATRRNSASA